LVFQTINFRRIVMRLAQIDFENEKQVCRRRVGFRVYDTKRREFGLMYRISQVEVLPLPEGKMSGYPWSRPYGWYFQVATQSARGPRPFGPSQPYKYFATLEEAEQWVEKRVADSRKRAENNKDRVK
jgi:hypothetical protein